MFYIPEILARKGPLSIVWLAAHFDKKVTKNQIMSANISDIIDLIMSSNIRISLRITCDLIIGICKINKFKNKFLLDESEQCINQVQLLARKVDPKKKSKLKSIDLSDQVNLSSNLNIPEIFDFVDLTLPDPSTIMTTPVTLLSRRSVTIDEIPPLTEEEVREEEEIHKRIYSLGDKTISDSDTMSDFFEDILPSPHIPVDEPPLAQACLQEKPLSSPLPPIIDDAEYTTIVTPTNGQTIRKRRPDLKESIEKRRKFDTDPSLQIGSLELVVLDESSVRSSRIRRPRISPRRRRRLIFDEFPKIPDNVMRKNYKRINLDMMVPDLFIPSTRLVDKCNLFNVPLRLLPNSLNKHFTNGFNNAPLSEEVLTTTIESVQESTKDEYFDSLPGPPPTQDLFDQPAVAAASPHVGIGEFEDAEVPMVRGMAAEKYIDQQQLPEFSTTDRTIIEEQFNNSLHDLFSKTDILTFDQLSIPENRKSAVVLYFYNLLEMKNNELIDLTQDPSLEQFNPIYIIHIYRSEAI